MPGCTVPNCFNSSIKGFRVYHFPQDKDRRLQWASNIGRDAGWIPTQNTCVCEIHFEENQFESHRADGLRRLKPNAVPTIFDLTNRRVRRKRKPPSEVFEPVSESDHLQAAGHTYQKRKRIQIKPEVTLGSEDEDDPSSLQMVQVSSSSVFKKVETARNKGRTSNIRNERGATKSKEEAVNSKNQKETFESENIEKTSENKSKEENNQGTSTAVMKGRWRRKPDMNASRMYTDVNEKDNEAAKENSSGPTENSEVSEAVKCFMCNKDTKKVVSLKTRTNTTKIEMIEKLLKTVNSNNMLSLQEEKNVLCPRCAQLLNYVDRIEMELTMLNKAISNSILKKKKLIKASQPQKPQESTDNQTESRQPGGGSVTQNLEGDYSWLTDANARASSQNKSMTKTTKSVSTFTDDIPRPHTCRICRFQTPYNSVMVFHLRQHLKYDSKRCDFCNNYLKLEDHAFQNKDYEKECQENRAKHNNDSNNDAHLLISKSDKSLNSSKSATKPRSEYITESLEKAGVIPPKNAPTVQLLPLQHSELQVVSSDIQILPSEVQVLSSDIHIVSSEVEDMSTERHDDLQRFSSSSNDDNILSADFPIGSSVLETGTLVLENVPLSEDSSDNHTSGIMFTILPPHENRGEEVTFLSADESGTTENGQNLQTEDDPPPQFINVSEGFVSVVSDAETCGTNTVSYYENVSDDVNNETQSIILNNVLVPAENVSFQQSGDVPVETAEGTTYLVFQNAADSSTFNEADCENSDGVQVLSNMEAILIQEIASAPELTPVIEQLAQETTSPVIDKYPESSSAPDMPDIEMLPADPVEESFDAVNEVSIDEGMLAEDLNLPPLAESPSNEVIDIIIADEAVLDGSVLQLSQ